MSFEIAGCNCFILVIVKLVHYILKYNNNYSTYVNNFKFLVLRSFKTQNYFKVSS